MLQGDFEGFSALMRRVAAVYSKKIDDDVVHGYWIALKDQSLPTITDLANTHTRFGKFFPKPNELRPKDDKPDPTPDGKFEEGEKRAMEGLEDLRRKRPEEWFERVGKDSHAATYANTFGVENIWFDVQARCWRKLVSDNVVNFR